MFGQRPTSRGPVFPSSAPNTLLAPPPLFPASGLSFLAGNSFASSPAGFGLQARPTGALGAAAAPLPTFGQHSSASPFTGTPRPPPLGATPSGMAPVSLFAQGQ